MFSAFQNFLKNVPNAYKLKILFVKDDCTRDGHSDTATCAYMGQFLQGGNFLHPLTNESITMSTLHLITFKIGKYGRKMAMAGYQKNHFGQNKRLTFILGVVTRMLYLKKNTQNSQNSHPAETHPYARIC